LTGGASTWKKDIFFFLFRFPRKKQKTQFFKGSKTTHNIIFLTYRKDMTSLGGYAGKGGGGKNVKGKKLTGPEAAKKKNEYWNRIKAIGSHSAGPSKAIYIEAHKASADNLVFRTEPETGALLVDYNVGTKEMPVLSSECYILPPGIGTMAKNMAGYGSKWEEGDEQQKQGDEFSAYTFNMYVSLGLTLPPEVYAACKDADKHVTAAIKFFEERKKRFIKEALARPEVYVSFKGECETAAQSFEDREVSNDRECSAEQRQSAYENHFEMGIRFGYKIESYTDDATGKVTKFFKLKAKTKAFQDNTGEDMPPEVEKELKEKKNINHKPIAQFIERAYAAGKRLNKIAWTDERNEPLPSNVFEPKFNEGATVKLAVKFSCYDRGGNRGTTIYIQKGATLYNTEYSRGDIDLGTSNYVKAKPRSAHEIVMLQMFKNNAKMTDGMSVDLMNKALAKKLKVNEMSNALATLVTDQFVINGKDDKHFKLANPELNVETLKVESEAAAAGGSGKQGAPPPLPSGGGGPGKAVAEAKKRPAKDEEEQEPDPDGEAISLFPADDDAEGLIGAAASGAGVVGDDDDDGRSAQSKQASLQQKHKSKKSKKDH
jgi:hypothetical protein